MLLSFTLPQTIHICTKRDNQENRKLTFKLKKIPPFFLNYQNPLLFSPNFLQNWFKDKISMNGQLNFKQEKETAQLQPCSLKLCNQISLLCFGHLPCFLDFLLRGRGGDKLRLARTTWFSTRLISPASAITVSEKWSVSISMHCTRLKIRALQVHQIEEKIQVAKAS